MIRRRIYRALLWLHPPDFKEQHGEEMLCIFDESPPAESSELLVDGIDSVARQWLLHSGIWKMAVGALVSALALVGWADSMNWSFRWSMEWSAKRAAEIEALDPPKPSRPLNRQAFAREAAQAAAMLRRMDGAPSGQPPRANGAATRQHSAASDSSPQ